MASADTTDDPVREPDVMNDPEFDTNRKGKEKSTDDADTCRICRGESSKDEPLFYPCKCSGSIKFVHQSCLMEWLSHSQKKHCELCKTPFRFTKLYHPNMPNSVPLPIFLRQAAVHTWKTFLTWSRFHVVLFVWVVWLPWCMRIVWRALFWIADGGWINWQKLQEQALSVTQEHMDTVLGEQAGSASTKIPMAKDVLASAMFSRVANALPNFLSSSSSQALNFTERDPLLIKFAKNLMVGVIARTSSQSVPFLATSSLNTTGVPTIALRSSWLSDFSFLRFLTPSPAFNNLVIDTLEGQIITLLVVISFILIFLIREWVVQQQPGVNIGAGPNANPPPIPGGEVPILERIARQRAEQRIQPAPDGQAVAEDEALVELPAHEAREPGRPARPANTQQGPHNLNEEHLVEAQKDPPELSTSDSQTFPPESSDAGRVQSHDHAIEAAPRRHSTPGQAGSPQRPSMPKRNSMARAAEIRRTLEEQSRASDQHGLPDHKIFLDLWGRAKNNPREVLRIIEQEGRTEELAWIVAAMSKLEIALDADKGRSDDNQTTEFGMHVDTSSSAIDYGLDVDAGPSISAETEPTWPTWSGLNVTDWEDERPGSDFITSQMGPAYSENGIEGLEAEASSSVLRRNSSLRSTKINSSSVVTSNTDSQSSRMQVRTAHDMSPVLEGPSELSASPSDQRKEDNPFHPEYEGYNEVDGNAAEGVGSSFNAFGSASETESHEGGEYDGPADQDHLESRIHLPNDQNGPGRNQNLGETIMNWLWGDINAQAHLPVGNPDHQGGDDERIVADLANEAPFIPVEDGHPVINDVNDAEDPLAAPLQDPEVAAAAAQAGLDPVGLDPNGAEVVEDVEDLEGIMELVGMQGPLAALIQNGMFCAILVSMTIFLGVWIPYIAGKLFLVFLANPISLLFKLPLRWASISADLVIDVGVFSAGCSFFWVDTIVRLVCAPVGWLIPPIARLSENKILAETAKRYAESAMERLAKTFVATGGSLSETDIPMFSIIAHESLKTIETSLNRFLQAVGQSFISLIHFLASRDFGYEALYRSLTTNAADSARTLSHSVAATTSKGAEWISSVLKINLLRVSFNIPQRTTLPDYNMAYWNTKDRIIAIIFGYMFFSLLGFIYIKVRASFRGRGGNGKVEGVVADVLYQAGGVLKVVLIISIEMIVFPLYCGLLLDIALLPLFGNVTALSRVDFLLTSPNTSLFVHWFIGTCYMFHFALFVSMCRKIMRSGVLCKLLFSTPRHIEIWSETVSNSKFADFIRDPDDPTFHPVRDVLERSVSTQLRKIAFSALVYGALVILCLGGVVWGIYFTFENVFPIHWSSNEPVLEFPVDLLFYNFLMPVAVKFFKPSVGLTSMYGWWFRKCARALRLSHFLFGERAEDEEGYHVHRSWKDWLLRKKGDYQNPISDKEGRGLFRDGDADVFFVRDGHYVRAPASDQVRIPKGVNTFLEVDETGARSDGELDSDHGLHGRKNDMFSKLYIPPFFRIRISLFIVLIWLFAATTGVAMTIVPLVLGRYVFTFFIPNHLRMNDIYAFSIGLYILGGTVYGIINFRRISTFIFSVFSPNPQSNTAALLRYATKYSIRLVRVLYTYISFAFLLPALFSLLVEVYLIIPLHTYFGAPSERHIIHFIQDWTLGVLYIKMLGRLILWNSPSRPANALRGIIRHGWLNPDIRLATRSFIFPASLFMAFALVAPLALGWVANKSAFGGADPAFHQRVYRYSYPAVLALGVLAFTAYGIAVAFRGWRQRIRDEVYLIGERLHNFGERKVVGGRLNGRRVFSSNRA